MAPSKRNLNIVFAVLSASRSIENDTGCIVEHFIRTAGRYFTIEIQPAQQTITAADPLPTDLHEALTPIRCAH